MNIRLAAIVSATVVIATVGGYAAFLVSMSWPLEAISVGKSGVFGDSFGILSALFSGLAFVGLIATALMQREELELQRIALEEQKQAAAAQTRFMALGTAFQIYEIRRNVAQTASSDDLFRVVDVLEKQIDEVIK